MTKALLALISSIFFALTSLVGGLLIVGHTDIVLESGGNVVTVRMSVKATAIPTMRVVQG